MLGDIDPVAFVVLNPTLGNRAIGIFFGSRVGNLLDLFNAVHLEAEMMNTPGILVAMDQREIHVAVG